MSGPPTSAAANVQAACAPPSARPAQSPDEARDQAGRWLALLDSFGAPGGAVFPVRVSVDEVGKKNVRPMCSWTDPDSRRSVSWAGANAWGVIPPPGVAVLDLDSADAVERARGAGLLDAGMVVRTRSGGYHVYLADRGGLARHTACAGYDWRDGSGRGWVFGPGSRCGDTGWSVLSSDAPRPLTDAILTAFPARAAAAGMAPRKKKKVSATSQRTGRLAGLVVEWSALVAQLPEDERAAHVRAVVMR